MTMIHINVSKTYRLPVLVAPLFLLLPKMLLSLPLPYPPLLHAVADGNSSIVRLLLRNNADPNLQDNDGTTALAYAVRHNYHSIFRLLIDCDNIMLDKKDSRGATPLFYSVHNKKTFFLTRSLIAAGADIQVQNNRRQTLLIKAAICNRVDILHELLRCGACLHARDVGGYTAVMWAATLKNDDAMQYLTDRGAGITPDELNALPQVHHTRSFRRHIALFNERARSRSTLIESELYKRVPKVLAVLIRQFETPIPSHAFDKG